MLGSIKAVLGRRVDMPGINRQCRFYHFLACDFWAGHLFYSESVFSNKEWKYGCEDQNEITCNLLLLLSLIMFIKNIYTILVF